MTGQRLVTIETMSSGFAIIWGLYVANPATDLFERNVTLYAPMLSIVPYELFWGVFYIIAGFASLWLWFTGRHRVAQLILSIIFMLFSGMYVLADPSAPAWALFGWISLCNFIHFAASKWTLQTT